MTTDISVDIYTVSGSINLKKEINDLIFALIKPFLFDVDLSKG